MKGTKKDKSMKAAISFRHGPPEVLQIKEVEKPVPGDNEVLIKIHAATVTVGDVILRKLHPLLILPMRIAGIKRKKIPGHEFAGEVESIGKSVTRFRIGDRVFGTTTGLSVGANAEFVCLPEERKTGVLALMPNNLTYEQAAAVPVGGMTALYILGKGHLQKAQRQQVLIYGASGSVGTYAVQLAKYFGTEVTAVCSSRNAEIVKSLGADRIIDYTREDFIKSGQRYDVIFDAVGKTSAAACKSALKDDGIFLTVQSSTREDLGNLLFLKELIETEQLIPLIDKSFPLEQVAEAHRYVETGQKTGNVVININHQN